MAQYIMYGDGSYTGYSTRPKNQLTFTRLHDFITQSYNSSSALKNSDLTTVKYLSKYVHNLLEGVDVCILKNSITLCFFGL
jgi:hypothetical protein